MNNYRN